MVTLADVERARTRLAGVVRPTPLIHSYALGRRLGCEVFLKPEMLQRTGSFKLRGAYNKIAGLLPVDRARGVIAASAGNHAQGVAVAAALAGIPAVVVMPETAPRTKVDASRAYGAEVVQHGAHFQDALAEAERIRAERGLTLIPGFDDPAVIAGQGTIGLEILDELSAFDAVVVPVGGGGLIAGIATALKTLSPPVQVIGVQAERAPAAVASLAAGRLVTVPVGETIADGIAVERPGLLPFEIIRHQVDDVVTVGEAEIRRSIALLLQRAKLVAEGAGAVPLAAVLAGLVPVQGRRVVLVLSGGNIDLPRLATIAGGEDASLPPIDSSRLLGRP
jgi:threonine dehydratase